MFRNLISLVIVVAFGINAFAQNEKISVFFSGQVKNPIGESITISNQDGFTQSIDYMEPGEFSDLLEISKKGLYTFTAGNESTSIYLDKGYRLDVSVDTKQFDESLNYRGKGSLNNNFLAQKYLINETQMGDMLATYRLNEDEFIEKYSKLREEYQSLLKKLKDDNFTNFQNQDIEYDYFLALSSYEAYHQYATKNNEFKVSKGFLKPIQDLNYESETDYVKYDSYKKLVLKKYTSGLSDASKISTSINEIQKIESKIIKTGIQKQLLESIDIKNNNAVSIFETILEEYKDQELIDKAKDKFNNIKPLMPGQPSANFSYKDVDGKTINLEELRGKVVYIDVWATWCAPCIAEIPHLKKMESEFHDKDMAFVSISVDRERDFDKWKKMVGEKNLKGYQLFADKSWSSSFIKAYQIKSIPTFILIDKKGNIISANATRPSNPDTRKLFEELLNK